MLELFKRYKTLNLLLIGAIVAMIIMNMIIRL